MLVEKGKLMNNLLNKFADWSIETESRDRLVSAVLMVLQIVGLLMIALGAYLMAT
jgi:methionyl-tRNA synthetase